MIILISAVIIVLYIILIAFTLHNLNSILDFNKKVIFTVSGLVLIIICTFIVFSISASGLQYNNTEIIGKVRLIMLAVFTPVNGMVTMPYLSNLISKTYSNTISLEKLKKRIILMLLIFLTVLIFECSYLRNIQLGIISIINNM